MKERGKKTWNAVTTVLIYMVVLGAVALVAARAAGYQPYTVLSGSMEPNYPTGSLIYVKQAKTDELREGDVITFLLDEDTVVTHRIVETIPDEADPSVIRYRTKGDANRVEDGGLVHCRNVIGTPVFVVPKLGYALQFMQSPMGRYIIIFTGVFLLLMAVLPGLGEKDKRKPKRISKKEMKKRRTTT